MFTTLGPARYWLALGLGSVSTGLQWPWLMVIHSSGGHRPPEDGSSHGLQQILKHNIPFSFLLHFLQNIIGKVSFCLYGKPHWDQSRAPITAVSPLFKRARHDYFKKHTHCYAREISEAFYANYPETGQNKRNFCISSVTSVSGSIDSGLGSLGFKVYYSHGIWRYTHDYQLLRVCN